MSIRHYLWSERKKAAIKVRAKILDIARSWFRRHNYIEVQGPVITPAIGNRSNSFKVEYFGREAYLSQGLHLYAEALMMNLGRIWTIAPVFREEKIRSDRHLTEYWHIEAESPHTDLNGLMKIQEKLVSHICQRLTEEAEEEFGSLQRDTKELKMIQSPFPRLRYEDAINMLQKNGFDVQWGAILEWEHEEYLSMQFSQPFFVSEFPVGVETYFYQFHPEKPELTLSVDLLAPEGYGEISTGGQPTVEKDELLRKMREEKTEPNEQKWYIDLKKMDCIPYSGFAMGVERLTRWICRLEHINEVSAFPRSTDNIYP